MNTNIKNNLIQFLEAGCYTLDDPVSMHQCFPNLEKYVQTHLRAIIYSAL